MKINCLFVTNGFLNSKKFNELYHMISEAAYKYGINLIPKRNCDIIADTHTTYNFKEYDCCLFWDKDIPLGRFLESNGLRLFNSIDAIEKCDDKALTHIELSKYNIKMPRTIVAPMTYDDSFENLDFFDAIINELGYPFVIKERKGSFGMQVYLVHNKMEFLNLIKEKSLKDFIIQEFIKTSIGRDVRINFVGDTFCAAMLRSSDNDFRANLSIGGKMEKYNPTKLELDVCSNVMRALKLDYAGIDLLFDENDIPYLCEVNSNAHFKNIYECTGINMAEKLMKHIKDSMN